MPAPRTRRPSPCSACSGIRPPFCRSPAPPLHALGTQGFRRSGPAFPTLWDCPPHALGLPSPRSGTSLPRSGFPSPMPRHGLPPGEAQHPAAAKDRAKARSLVLPTGRLLGRQAALGRMGTRGDTPLGWRVCPGTRERQTAKPATARWISQRFPAGSLRQLQACLPARRARARRRGPQAATAGKGFQLSEAGMLQAAHMH